MTTFPALFDTNVLFGFHLNDALLGMAERSLFRPLWTDRVLGELEKNLVAHGVEPGRVVRRLSAMQASFPDATVIGYDELIPMLTCDSKDRHVLAAAIRANAEVLVTFNLKDFPASSVAPYDIEVVHPDKFLLDQLDLYPGPTVGVLQQLVRDYSRPELSFDDLLVILADAGVPEFAQQVRDYV